MVEVPALHEVQDKRYEEPTILLAKQVSGEEEIPENVVGVVTPDAPDILSHSSVRARNMEVLLVTCHDPEPLDEISGYVGKLLSIQTTAAGNVTWNVADAADVEASSNGNSAKGALRGKLKMEIPEWCAVLCLYRRCCVCCGMRPCRVGLCHAAGRGRATLAAACMAAARPPHRAASGRCMWRC